MSEEFHSKIVLKGVDPLLHIQNKEQFLLFDEIHQTIDLYIDNNFTTTQELDSINGLNLSFKKDDGITLLVKQSKTEDNNTMHKLPVLYFSNFKRELDQQTELYEKTYYNIMEMGVIENVVTTDNETTTIQIPYVKSYGNLDLNNNKIINLSAPVNGTDAVNKDYVDNSINNIDYSTFVTNTGLSTTLNDYTTNTDLTNTLDDYATKTYVDNLSFTPTLGSYPISHVNSILPIMFDVSGETSETYLNPQCFASPLSPFLCVIPNNQQDKILITIDGVNFRRKTITSIFNIEPAQTYNVTGWFDTTLYKFCLLITKPTVKLVATTDFNTFQEITPLTNSNLLEGQTLLTSCYMMDCGFALIQTSTNLYRFHTNGLTSNTFETHPTLRGYSSYSPDLESNRKILFNPLITEIVAPYKTTNNESKLWFPMRPKGFSSSHQYNEFLPLTYVGLTTNASSPDQVVALDYQNHNVFCFVTQSNDVQWYNLENKKTGNTALHSINSSTYYIRFSKGFFKGYLYSWIEYVQMSSAGGYNVIHNQSLCILDTKYYSGLTTSANTPAIDEIKTIRIPKLKDNDYTFKQNIYNKAYEFPTPQETNCYGLGFSPALRKYVR